MSRYYDHNNLEYLKKISRKLDVQQRALERSNRIQAMHLVATLQNDPDMSQEKIREIAHEFGVIDLLE